MDKPASKKGGKPSRDKGSRFERAVVNELKAKHLDARRVPLSGAMWLKGDVEVSVHWRDDPLRLECKIRKDGFKEIYRWLDKNDALVIRADGQPALAVLPLSMLADLLQ
jgi:Holliday junction resolvase